MLQRRQEAIQALNDIARNPKGILVRFQKGDQVWLEATNLRLPFQASKLNPKRYGPFKVQKVLSPVAYQLELPNTWRIHNTFHSSLLSPYHETTVHGLNFSCPPLDLIDEEEEQEIEHILAHRYFGKKKQLQYLIKWKGFPESENEWVSPLHMHAPDLIRQYHRRNPPPTIKAILSGREKDIAPSTTPVRSTLIPNKPCLTCPSIPPLPRSPQPLPAQSIFQLLHPLNRFQFHPRIQCSMTHNGSRNRCRPIPPLWHSGSMNKTSPTSLLPATSPRGSPKLSRGGKMSMKEKSYDSRTASGDWRIASFITRRTLPLRQMGTLKTSTTPTSSSPSATGSFALQKWIKLLEEGQVAMYASDDGPSSPPTIGLIHAQPNTDTTLTVEPLPAWYKALLMGPATAFHTYRRTLSHPQQWGTRADVTHYRAIDEEIVKASSRLRAVEVEIEDLQLSRSLVQARLKMACAAQQAKGLEPLALGRHVTFCGGAWKKTCKVDNRGQST